MKRLGSKRGQSLVSSALVFVAAFMMLAAILDIGQLVLFLSSLQERTRSVARYAAVHEYDESKLTAMVAGFMGVKRSMVTIKRADGLLEVSIHDYPLRFLTPFLSGGKTPRSFRTVVPIESQGSPE